MDKVILIYKKLTEIQRKKFRVDVFQSVRASLVVDFYNNKKIVEFGSKKTFFFTAWPLQGAFWDLTWG